MNCTICGKPQSPYPNFLISRGIGYHVGCLVADYREMKKEVIRLLHHAAVAGTYGPWSDKWEGSWSQKHWNEIGETNGA